MKIWLWNYSFEIPSGILSVKLWLWKCVECKSITWSWHKIDRSVTSVFICVELNGWFESHEFGWKLNSDKERVKKACKNMY